MTFKELENAYMHDMSYNNLQAWLMANHKKIFHKNTIQHENPFVCGFIQSIVNVFIDKTQYDYDIPTWLFQYMATHRARFITCVHDVYILEAKKQNTQGTYNDGYSISLDRFKGANPYFCEDEKGNLTLFLI